MQNYLASDSCYFQGNSQLNYTNKTQTHSGTATSFESFLISLFLGSDDKVLSYQSLD